MRIWVGGPRFAGVRTGVSFNPDSFFRRLFGTLAGKTATMAGSFVYVIKGARGMSKIGVSTNPGQRIADLQTGSPYALNFEYIGMTTGNGFDIENEAHMLLDNHRQIGEWFDVPPDMAVAAVHGAAHRLGYTLTPVSENQLTAAMEHLQARSNTARLSPMGWVLFTLYIAAVMGIMIVWGDIHFLTIIIVAAILARVALRPVLLRFFCAPTAP